jgi:hypothetical protein
MDWVSPARLEKVTQTTSGRTTPGVAVGQSVGFSFRSAWT